MNLLDQLAEAHIQNAMERGALDDLPGAGQPLPPDEASQVPPELRAGYRLLKNAGYVPPEINQAREIRELTDLLAAAEAGSEQAHKAGAGCVFWSPRLRPAATAAGCFVMRTTTTGYMSGLRADNHWTNCQRFFVDGNT